MPGGELFPGQTTTADTVTFYNPSGLKLAFKSGLLAMPAPNADPIFDAHARDDGDGGPALPVPGAAHDPNRYA